MTEEQRQESLSNRIVRIETQFQGLEGWLKSINQKVEHLDGKLDEHVLHHRNGSNGNGARNGNMMIIIPKWAVGLGFLSGGIMAGLVAGIIEAMKSLGLM
jgi:hypothetical protein